VDCQTSPLSIQTYRTREELDALLIGRWQRCTFPQARGEDVGVEFTPDGRYHALTRDAAGNVVRRVGIDYGGTWEYFPAGSSDPISGGMSADGYLVLDGSLTTSPPIFTNDPRQLRIMFSPALSRYVPLGT
jgi:YD repeat-containing protein